LLELSLKQARRLTIGAQLLAGPPPRRPTKSLMRQVIQQLGAVQIDAISVVARSHHIALWSRLGDHPPEWLDELLAEDRAVFEYWAHAAAYAPIELFPYFRRKMLAYAEHGRWRDEAWIRENDGLLEQVMDHVRHNGPVNSKDFAAPAGAERAAPWAWYGNKPTNRALDILWTKGDLMIDRREKFSRYYDLTERVHPNWSDEFLPSEQETHDQLGRATLQALGVATTPWLLDYFRSATSYHFGDRSTARAVAGRLVESGAVVPARVEGIGDVLVETAVLNRRFQRSRTTLLSPFDSLIWGRRARELFGFDTRLEAYTPAHKRVYGYFSLPILHQDQLVGRIDPKVDRRQRSFSIPSLHLEPWFIGQDDDQFYGELAEALWSFAAFNEAETFVIERSEPEHARFALSSALAEGDAVLETAERRG
jgi:hypothetical protein